MPNKDLASHSFQALAEKHSAHSFFNSLLRDWPEHSLIITPAALAPLGARSVRLALPKAESFLLPLRRISPTGRHEYAGRYFRERDLEELDFQRISSLVAHSLALAWSENPQVELFQKRVQLSAKVIEHTLRHREAKLRELFSGHFSFSEAEQGMAVGHPFHPSPKSREEFSLSDLEQFSPESGGKFPLHWLRVPLEFLFERHSSAPHQKNWRRELFAMEFGREFSGEGEPFPVHPWQKPKILALPALAGRRDKIEDLGASPFPWLPTSSLRTVYREESPWMLKFSLSLRLTNSIRHLLPREAERGLQVSEVFASALGQKFLANHPRFRILFEHSFAALKDEAGDAMAETMVVIRENPSELIEEKVAVLGTLTQDHPFCGENLIAQQIRVGAKAREQSLEESAKYWFRHFLDSAIEPLLRAQAEIGVLLGAHQQNLLLSTSHHLPERAYFRDCQGTGYSQLGYSLFAGQVERIQTSNGNVMDEKIGNSLFSYYLVINSAFGVIAAIGSSGFASEESLLDLFRQRLESMRAENPPDPSCLNYLLDHKNLWQKGNFLCSIGGLNENTTSNPFAIYNEIPNPIFATREKS